MQYLIFLSPSSVLYSERKEQAVFKEMLRVIPGLERRLMESSEEEVITIADLVRYSLVFIPILIYVLNSDSERCQRR